MVNESVKKHVLGLRSELEKTREQRDTHLRRAEKIATTELQQVRKERLLNHGQVHTKHEANLKVLREAKLAIADFESASDGVQQLGQKLDTALRGLGDVENFLDILSERTQKVSERIVTLLSSEDQGAKSVDNSDVVRNCKKLQPHRERLQVDMLALASGLRPAFLLDYAPTAPVSVIESLCKAVSDIYDLQLEYAQQVQQILSVMRQHNEVTADAASSGPQEQQGSRHLLQIPDEGVLDAVIPFVNGVLLGYPFVYCVSSDTVNRACLWLSTTELLLCGFNGEPKQIPGCVQQVADSSDLWQCSVPLEMVDASGKVVDVLALWKKWSASRLRTVPDCWNLLRPFTRQVSMQAIVL